MYFQNRKYPTGLILIIIYIFLTLSSSLHASRIYKPIIEDPLLEQWRWVKFPELSSKGVQCFMEDNNQTMWFGLDEGVMSYDGSEWKAYNHNNGFTNGTVRVLYLSKNGLLYAGSDSGLFVYNSVEWRLLFSTKDISGLVIESVIDIPNQGILCATNYGLIRIHDEKTQIYTSKSQVNFLGKTHVKVKVVSDNVIVNNSFYVADVYEDVNKKIWLAIGYNNGLSGKIVQIKFPADPQSNPYFSVLYSDNPNTQFYNGAQILQTSDDRIWVINNQHDQGYLVFENNKLEKFFLGKQFGSDEIANSLLQTKDGTLFIGAMGILYTYKDNKWELYRSPNIPIPSSTRVLIYESKDGNLWIAGKRNEVYKFDYSTTNSVSYTHLTLPTNREV